MPVRINLRHLEKKNLFIEGEVTPAELELEEVDELIRVTQPLKYRAEAQKLERNLLVQGELSLILDCECARCLAPFQQEVRLEHWAAHIPLEGEDIAPVVNDCVDLTPYIREDILLSFPQHPLCKEDCAGLPERKAEAGRPDGAGRVFETAPDWSELNKLKLK